MKYRLWTRAGRDRASRGQRRRYRTDQLYAEAEARLQARIVAELARIEADGPTWLQRRLSPQPSESAQNGRGSEGSECGADNVEVGPPSGGPFRPRDGACSRALAGTDRGSPVARGEAVRDPRQLPHRAAAALAA